MAQKMNNLEDLFVDTLQDLYDAEHQIVKALPQMASQAQSKELKQSFENHLEVTRKQIDRLDQIFKEMKLPVQGKHCKGMEGIIQEGQEATQMSADPAVKDAALIASAQKVEHYEIAGYGTARAYAQALGHHDAARLLDQTGNEEGQADKKLTAIAEDHINRRAETGHSSGF